MRRDLAAPGLVSSLANQPGLLSLSAVFSRRVEPSTNCVQQAHQWRGVDGGGGLLGEGGCWGSLSVRGGGSRNGRRRGG